MMEPTGVAWQGVADDTASYSSPYHPPRPFGILVVHGLGEQEQTDTLVSFGEPIIRFLQQWLRGDTRRQPAGTVPHIPNIEGDAETPPPVTDCVPPSSTLNPDPSIGFITLEGTSFFGQDTAVPAHAMIQVDGRPDLPPWLLAESWWAGVFNPPTFTEVLSWGVRVVPSVLLDTVSYQLTQFVIRSTYNRERGVNRNDSQGANTSALAQVVFAMVIGPLLYATLLLLLPIASIPFLRGLLGNVAVRLARTLGDPYLLLSSPLRFGPMIERIQHDIRWLQHEGCDGIAIVAHSQGAALAHHALRTFRPGDQRAPITRFVTFGAAINKVHYLQELEGQGNSFLRGGRMMSVAALGLLFTVLFGWRLPEWGSKWDWLDAQSWWRNSLDDGLQWTIALALLFYWLFWFGPRLLDVFGIIELRAFRGPKPDVLWDRENHHAPGAPKAKWIDLYARADPVSLGPIESINTESPHPLTDPDCTSAEIRNQDSMLFDHTSYFQNTSQFMVPLVGGLCRDSGWTDILDMAQPLFREADRQRSRRVDWLNRAAIVVWLSFLIASLALAQLAYLNEVGTPLTRMIEFVGDEVFVPFVETFIRYEAQGSHEVQTSLGFVTLVLVAALYHLILVKRAWWAWDAGKAETLLAQRQASRRFAASNEQAQLLGPFWDGSLRFRILAVLVPLTMLSFLLYLALG